LEANPGTVAVAIHCKISRFSTVAVAGFLAACGNHGGSIAVDREILFPDLNPRVDAVARTREGGFVVMGVGVAAWVVATDSEGHLLWQYKDPVDDSVQTVNQAPQTEYHAAVPMANGNTLLCGGSYKSGGTENLIVILDSRGKQIERRVEVPNENTLLVHSSFYDCFAWRDGIMLLGGANDGKHGYVWLVELDADGAKRRQALVDNVKAAPGSTVAGPGFVFTAWNSPDDFRVVRADEKGETIATRVIAGEFMVQLRSIVESRNTWILIYRTGKATLYALDERLQDIQAPRDIKGYFDPQAGRGYVLADGSLVLFSRGANAAIALINQQGKTQAMREFDSRYISYSVAGAVPISADEFVTVRGSVSRLPKDQGLVMSWVKIKEGR
jgi:hypothetical protein